MNKTGYATVKATPSENEPFGYRRNWTEISSDIIAKRKMPGDGSFVFIFVAIDAARLHLILLIQTSKSTPADFVESISIVQFLKN